MRPTERFGRGSLTRRAASGAKRVADDHRRGSYPPPYPDGWYRLLGSGALRRGQARYLECLGRALVVWRAEDADSVFAMTAFCPHMGANLAMGRVCADRIECPFHGWQFDGDGRAVSVPYSAHVPARAANETFPVEEVHGQIFMYHRGGADGPRSDHHVPYRVPRVEEVDSGRFVFRGHHNAGRVRTHVIELLENAADTAHFGHLHTRLSIPWTQMPVPGFGLEHAAHLRIDEAAGAFGIVLDVETVITAFGRRLDRSRSRTQVTFTGPGSILNFRLAVPDAGEIEIVQTQLPVAPLEQQVDFHWFADRSIPRPLVWYAVGNWVSQWRNDVRIWESKAFRQTPALCRDDGPVMRLRRWYSQFYPDAATGQGSPAALAAADQKAAVPDADEPAA